MPITYTYGQEDNVPSFVETGVYPATVKRATEKQSKSGNKMIELIWKCDNDFELFDHIVDLSGKCRDKSNALVKAKGDGMELDKGEKVELDASEMVGWRVDLEIELKDGKNNVTGYQPITESKDKNTEPFK